MLVVGKSGGATQAWSGCVDVADSLAGVVPGTAVSGLDRGEPIEDAIVHTAGRWPRHPYARGLLATTPRMEAAITPRLPTIPGAPRSGGAMLPSCPFAPRCSDKMPACDHMPPLRDIGPERRLACHLEPAP